MKVKTLIITFTALLALALPAFAATESEGVGTVKELAGTVTVTHGGASAALTQGAAIFPQDIVETALQSRVKIDFRDGTEIVLSGKGKLDVAEYMFDEADETRNKARFNFAGGAFSYVSGLVAKKENPDVIINMDFGSIGIRGTRILGALKNRLNWIYVDKGAAEFSNAGGKALLPAGNGTSIRSAEDAPRPPYLWGEDEINWLQRAVDDPGAQDTTAMVARLEEKKQVAEESALGGGAAANELGAPAAARPAAPALDAPAEADIGAARAKAVESISPVDVKTAGKADMAESIMRFEADKPQSFPIGAMDPATLLPADGVIVLSAQLKAEKITGSAYLELRVHAEGQDGPEVYARTLDNQLTAAGDWQSFATRFEIKNAARPDEINASLVINGTGTVLVKDLQLRATTK